MPASIAQEQLWEATACAARALPFLNVLCPLRLTSVFDATILERSINEIVQRHEILRTTFAESRWSMHADYCAAAKRASGLRGSADFATLQEEKRRASICSRRSASFLRPCARSSVSSSSGALGETGAPPAHHHAKGIIVDGWSLGILVQELITLYDAFYVRDRVAAGTAPHSVRGLCALAAGLAVASGNRCAARLLAEQLRDPLPVIELATVPPRRTIDSFRTARREVTLPARLVGGR